MFLRKLLAASHSQSRGPQSICSRRSMTMLILSALLLFSQASLALHDVDHQFHESTVSCDQFMLAEGSDSTLESVGFKSGDRSLLAISIPRKISLHLDSQYQIPQSRGPPCR